MFVYIQILLIALLAIVQNANAHGYCYSPISRNFLATVHNPSNPGGIGKWWVPKSDPSYATTPYPENCPHCLNRKSEDGFCGYDDRSRNYDSPKNFEGKPLQIETQSTYTTGGEIEIESVLTAHHMGHIQVGGCLIDELSDDCFNSNLLTFVEDLSDYETKANVDTLHPERAHVHPAVGIGTDSSTTASGSMRFKHKFRLPANLVGNHVVLQWRYLTANSCNYPDYDQYDWPAENWWSSALAQCDIPLSKTGEGAPEQFWNCLDVKIVGEGEDTDPTPPSPTPPSPTPPGPTPPSPTPPSPTPEEDPVIPGTCRTVGKWAGLSDEWCEINCNWTPSNCPPSHCICDGSVDSPEDEDERDPGPIMPPTQPEPEPEPEDPDVVPDPTPEPTIPIPTVPAPPVEFSGSVAVMYFVAWGTYARDVQVADIDGSKLTHINYAFANVSPDGRCILGDPYADVQKTFTAENSVDGVADTWDQPMAGNFNQLRKLKIKYPHIKNLISLGGWTWSDKFSAMAMTAAGREKFVDSCVVFMETYGFDGIDVDWEYPAKKGDSDNYRSEDRDNFTELLKEFRKKLDATGVHHPLTLATSATLVDVSYDVAAIHPYLDFINVMTYDFAGSWQKSTGHNAPLNTPPGAVIKSSFIASMEDWNRQGCPKDKLVGGLGYYGRSWGNVDSDVVGAAANGPGYGSWENGVIDYKDIKNKGWETGSDGWVKHFDKQAMVPYMYNSGTKQFISYDDEESICAKISWLKANGYKGGMAWDLSGDDGSLQGLTYDVLVGGKTCGSGFWTQSMLKSWKANADDGKIGGMDKNVVFALVGVGGMLVVGALVGGFVMGRASKGEGRPMKAEGVEIVDKAMV